MKMSYLPNQHKQYCIHFLGHKCCQDQIFPSHYKQETHFNSRALNDFTQFLFLRMLYEFFIFIFYFLNISLHDCIKRKQRYY